MKNVEKDYQVLETVCECEFATIFKAKEVSGGRIVAIKTIDLAYIIAQEKRLNTFYEKITALRKLRHDNIMKLHRVYESKEHVHLILDYIPYGDLMDLIEIRRSFDEDQVKQFSVKLLKVIDYIHEQGVVHRDLKPENILMQSIDDLCDFKVADFDLAGLIGAEKFTMKCGSPGYTAPEMLRGEPYDAKVDMFSAGVIFYLLLSGHMPFYGRNIQEIVRRNAEGIPSFDGRAWRRISSEAKEFVSELLTCDPVVRPDARTALKHVWLQEEEVVPGGLSLKFHMLNDDEEHSSSKICSLRTCTGNSTCDESPIVSIESFPAPRE
eukprot:CAMPEP_0204902928 /NCGR_PEP_ID=MMETSP1397-20131031/3960_1 /ASSEMBLY_ACC=CAM_ASM_000891 /TAXON_ID=49980 /ORGANISM="Climacostomum Climacostomum virens, Strain Stock W-24" /LENGTH=322 /DNA_ID=CAMNT_0052071505 /DNA_START=453 /DNA_END=1421 /DNA_ORIENTATION=+